MNLIWIAHIILLKYLILAGFTVISKETVGGGGCGVFICFKKDLATIIKRAFAFQLS